MAMTLGTDTAAFVAFAKQVRGAIIRPGDDGWEAARAVYNADIDRYALYRRHDVPYEQVTKERMRSPKATVRWIHAALVAEGYDGPPPMFGEQWESLFRPLAELVRPPRAA